MSNLFYNSVCEFLDNPWNHSLPLDSRVVVISDSDYKLYKQKQAQEEINVLEGRLRSYEQQCATIRSTIDELKKNAGLLPAEEPAAE